MKVRDFYFLSYFTRSEMDRKVVAMVFVILFVCPIAGIFYLASLPDYSVPSVRERYAASYRPSFPESIPAVKVFFISDVDWKVYFPDVYFFNGSLEDTRKKDNNSYTLITVNEGRYAMASKVVLYARLNIGGQRNGTLYLDVQSVAETNTSMRIFTAKRTWEIRLNENFIDDEGLIHIRVEFGTYLYKIADGKYEIGAGIEIFLLRADIKWDTWWERIYAEYNNKRVKMKTKTIKLLSYCLVDYCKIVTGVQ